MYPSLKKECLKQSYYNTNTNQHFFFYLNFFGLPFYLGKDSINITWIDNTFSLIFFSRLYFTSLNKKQRPVRYKKTWATTTFSWKQERWKPEFNTAARVHYIKLTWRALTSSFKILSSFSMHSAARVCFAWSVSQREFRDRSLFIAWGLGRIFGGITWFLGEQKGESVVTENPKGGIAENCGRIQRWDHSNLLGKWRHGGGRESH